MVVIGGMVGAGSLGFDIVAGFARTTIGKGLAAGIAIVLLGIMLDRITRRSGRGRRQPGPTPVTLAGTWGLDSAGERTDTEENEQMQGTDGRRGPGWMR